MREALARAEGQSQLLTTTATASGVAFITLATAAHAVHASPAWAKTFYVKDLTIDPDTLRILETVSYSLFAMSLFAASALALATAAIGLLKRAMPAWLAWFGVLAAVAGLFGVLGLPAVVILAWIAALSLSMAWPKRAEVEQTISPAG